MRALSPLLIALFAANSAFAAERQVPAQQPVQQPSPAQVPAEPATTAPIPGIDQGATAPVATLPKEGDQGESVFALQVALDRARFSPGVIDGHYGKSTHKALAAYQESKGRTSGELDDQTWAELTSTNIPSLVHIAVDPGDVGAVGEPLPAKPENLAGLPALNYGSLAEAVAEKFHTTPKALARLNNDQEIVAGADIIVPNVEGAVTTPSTLPVGGPLTTRAPATAPAPAQFTSQPPAPTQTGMQEADAKWLATLNSLSVDPSQPEAARVVVDKSTNEVRAFDSADRLIAAFPATIGSGDNPSPEGDLTIRGVSHNPRFKYDTDVLGERGPKKQFDLAPGPNNLVGIVWVDLSKPHNGIHGTGEPQNIGKRESHGCVRLTNWDAARLAQMVKPGTPVAFQ